MKTEPPLRIQLLETIGKFYPIGLPYSNVDFTGYQELLVILTEKIETLRTKNKIEPWCHIIDEIPRVCAGKRLNDLAFHQYPSLHLIVTLIDINDNSFTRTRTLQLFISLLGPYYTIFLTEELKSTLLDPEGLPMRVVLPIPPTLDDEKVKFNLVDKLVLQYYPQYKFVDHQFLMALKVFGGIPHGEDLESVIIKNPRFEFTAFDYLFGRFDSGNQ